jgi:hypothetical protein
MAAPVNTAARRRLALAVAAGTWPVLAGAEALFDPTRSPLGQPGAPAAAGETVPKEKAAPAPRLRLIVRGPGETRTALVDGRSVRVGDTLAVGGDTARVVSITDTRVVLARGAARETLELLPGAERSVSLARTAAQAAQPARDEGRPDRGRPNESESR